MVIALECIFFSYLSAVSHLAKENYAHQKNCFGANFNKWDLNSLKGHFGSVGDDKTES